MKTTAIIVAAGAGTRFQSDTPKQFVSIKGKPVILHTLERFQAAPSIDSILLVLSDAHFDIGHSFPGISKLTATVRGGSTRAESVLNGLSAASLDEEVSFIAVHDGARPLVSTDEIEQVVIRARETGAACLVAPVTDTIKSVRGGEIVATLDRDKLRRALTPQAFSLEVLLRAYGALGPAAMDAGITDECYLVEKLGHPIAFVEGNSRNIKLTTREDLVFIEAILNSEF